MQAVVFAFLSPPCLVYKMAKFVSSSHNSVVSVISSDISCVTSSAAES